MTNKRIQHELEANIFIMFVSFDLLILPLIAVDYESFVNYLEPQISNNIHVKPTHFIHEF